MEPNLPTPNILPPVANQNLESHPAKLEVSRVPSAEKQPAQSPEKAELPLNSPQPDPQAAAQAAQDAQAAATAGNPVVQTQTTPTDPLPLLASDDDLIEREWVAKAKQIVAQTRDDPHAQEKQISQLQADYVKKRFGKELKFFDA